MSKHVSVSVHSQEAANTKLKSTTTTHACVSAQTNQSTVHIHRYMMTTCANVAALKSSIVLKGRGSIHLSANVNAQNQNLAAQHSKFTTTIPANASVHMLRQRAAHILRSGIVTSANADVHQSKSVQRGRFLIHTHASVNVQRTGRNVVEESITTQTDVGANVIYLNQSAPLIKSTMTTHAHVSAQTNQSTVRTYRYTMTTYANVAVLINSSVLKDRDSTRSSVRVSVHSRNLSVLHHKCMTTSHASVSALMLHQRAAHTVKSGIVTGANADVLKS